MRGGKSERVYVSRVGADAAGLCTRSRAAAADSGQTGEHSVDPAGYPTMGSAARFRLPAPISSTGARGFLCHFQAPLPDTKRFERGQAWPGVAARGEA